VFVDLVVVILGAGVKGADEEFETVVVDEDEKLLLLEDKCVEELLEEDNSVVVEFVGVTFVTKLGVNEDVEVEVVGFKNGGAINRATTTIIATAAPIVTCVLFTKSPPRDGKLRS